MQCLWGSPDHCTSQHRPAPALHMVIFDFFIKAMPPSLSESKVLPSFCFAFKISDNRAASTMYIPCSLEFILERAKATARSWWILQKIFFITFKRFIPKQSFSLKIYFSESTHGLRTASKNRSKTYAAPCRYNLNNFQIIVVTKPQKTRPAKRSIP